MLDDQLPHHLMEPRDEENEQADETLDVPYIEGREAREMFVALIVHEDEDEHDDKIQLFIMVDMVKRVVCLELLLFMHEVVDDEPIQVLDDRGQEDEGHEGLVILIEIMGILVEDDDEEHERIKRDEMGHHE